jgi:hypothetical protein
MMDEEAKDKHANHVEQAILTGHLVNNDESLAGLETPHKARFRRTSLSNQDVYDDISSTSKSTVQQSTPMLIYGNFHQQKLGLTNSLNNSPSPVSSVKQRRAMNTRPSQLRFFQNEKSQLYDKTNIVYVDDDTPDVNDRGETKQLTGERNYMNSNASPNREQTSRLSPKIETYL